MVSAVCNGRFTQVRESWPIGLLFFSVTLIALFFLKILDTEGVSTFDSSIAATLSGSHCVVLGEN